MIMEVEINMINVEDGDAIILVLSDDDKTDVIVFDGGDCHFDRVKQRLDEILEEHDKTGPDLLICTHIDADHILGCTELISVYGNNVGELWVFPPSTYLLGNEDKMIKTFTPELIYTSIEGWGNYTALSKKFILKEGFEIFESFNQLKTLFELLKAMNFDMRKIQPPIKGRKFKDYDFEVLMPSEDFFKKYINAKNDFRKNIVDTSKNWNTNRVSVVTLLKNNGKQYLFTGDADRVSLNTLAENVSELHFLDVPHHGSIANISEDLASKFSAKLSFVSGVNDDHHPDDNVVNWLKTGGDVYITNKPVETWYLKLTKHGIVERYDDHSKIIS